MTVADAHITLCVDLDGTLIRTDLLHEGLLKAAKSAPHKLPSLFAALKGGKASFKHALAELIRIDPTLLVYRPEVMALINEARDKGRSVVLCTASPALFGKAVADHLGLFEAVMTSTSDINLAARHKAAALVNKFGEGNFDYIGNSKHDAPIFASCRRGYLVSSNGRLRRVCSANQRDMLFINDPATNALTWMKAMRVHQWVKNLLIFLPLLAGHQVGDMNRLVQAVLAFAAFSLCASAIYIANDLLDLDADRAHKSKRKRPFAAGMIPASSGVAAIAILLFASFLIATLLPWRFSIVLLGYVIVTTAYSFALKRQVVIDVMLLAGLYTLRIIAGAAATSIMPSFWLLAFSMFVFLCLAMVKRVSELRPSAGGEISGRGYVPSDMAVLLSLGPGCGLVSVLILALYMQSDAVLLMYPSKGWLWLVPPVFLYWIVRLWLKANRGEVEEDPVVFAMRDWQSLTIAGLIGILAALALWGPAPW